jgi:TPR repeat protein
MPVRERRAFPEQPSEPTCVRRGRFNRRVAVLALLGAIHATCGMASESAPPPAFTTASPPAPPPETPAPLSPNDPSTGFFGNLSKQQERNAEETEQRLTRARMAFLFGYYDLARDLWLPLAHDGNPKAQANIGWIYQTGKGQEKDLRQAYEWYLKAAKQGHEIAQNNLGVLYENGWGVKANQKRALYWYREAASVGYSYAQYNLGKMLLDGKAAARDPKEAAYWLGLAATQGVDDAKGLLIDKTKWGNAETEHLAVSVQPPAKQQHLKEVRREEWILSQPADSYTLQLLSSKNESTVTHYMEDQSVPDPSAYYKSKVLGEEWYSVIYGVFPTFEEAQKHLSLLPQGVLRYKPWARRFSDVQQLIRAPVD